MATWCDGSFARWFLYRPHFLAQVGDDGFSESVAENDELDLTCPKCGKTLGSRQAMRYHFASQNIAPNEPLWDSGGVKLCRKIDKKEIKRLQGMFSKLHRSATPISEDVLILA